MGVIAALVTFPLIISLISTALFIWFIVWIVRRIRKKKESFTGEYMEFVDTGRYSKPTGGKCEFCP